MKTKLLIITCLFLLLNSLLNAQPKNNLDQINLLINKSVVRVDSLLSDKQIINLSVTTAQQLEILKPSIFKIFSDNGHPLKTSDAESGISVNYSILSANVEYKNSYSEGLFGDIALEREVTLNGSFTISRLNKIIQPIEFSEIVTDTVNLAEVETLENKSLPFTQGQIPSLPLLSTFWEPIVVVGTLILTVILLFTVRGK